MTVRRDADFTQVSDSACLISFLYVCVCVNMNDS